MSSEENKKDNENKITENNLMINSESSSTSSSDNYIAQRDDLKRFLISAYQTNKEITDFMLFIDQKMRSVIQSTLNDEQYIHPPDDTFHRLLVHKMAEYYNLGHSTDWSTRQMYIYPKSDTILEPSLSDLYREIRCKKQPLQNVVKILKNPNRQSLEQTKPVEKICTEVRSFEERKNAYIQARSRILGAPIEECEAQFKNIEINVCNYKY
uniref:Protein encore (Trinotate prediction) n=1 Tax=Myxobolus squamalis TaxID=59785 RepID=A0A6B2G856_MYXSQ